ncbi:MAG: hypothetical protein ACP6IY_22935 [Promethearchaeia archaeon]
MKDEDVILKLEELFINFEKSSICNLYFMNLSNHKLSLLIKIIEKAVERGIIINIITSELIFDQTDNNMFDKLHKFQKSNDTLKFLITDYFWPFNLILLEDNHSNKQMIYLLLIHPEFGESKEKDKNHNEFNYYFKFKFYQKKKLNSLKIIYEIFDKFLEKSKQFENNDREYPKKDLLNEFTTKYDNFINNLENNFNKRKNEKIENINIIQKNYIYQIKSFLKSKGSYKEISKSNKKYSYFIGNQLMNLFVISLFFEEKLKEDEFKTVIILKIHEEREGVGKNGKKYKAREVDYVGCDGKKGSGKIFDNQYKYLKKIKPGSVIRLKFNEKGFPRFDTSEVLYSIQENIEQ